MTPPRHIAIIMDGNGRWATARGLPRIEGHRRGAESVRAVSTAAARLGVEALTLYCLSSENWKRPQEELDFLMTLLRQYVIDERELIMREGLRLRTIGRRDRLPADVMAEVDRTIEMSAENPNTQLVLAIDYGGRDEIVRAILRWQADEDRSETLDEIRFGDYLDTADLPDVDLMIRSGGDHRISNFLLWQISYAELYLTEVPWPEFGEAAFMAAVTDFHSRTRRFGGIDEA